MDGERLRRTVNLLHQVDCTLKRNEFVEVFHLVYVEREESGDLARGSWARISSLTTRQPDNPTTRIPATAASYAEIATPQRPTTPERRNRADGRGARRRRSR